MINVRNGDHTEGSFGLVVVDRLGSIAELNHRDLLRGPPQPRKRVKAGTYVFLAPARAQPYAANDEAAAPSSNYTVSTARVFTYPKDAAKVRRVRRIFEVSGKRWLLARGELGNWTSGYV